MELLEEDLTCPICCSLFDDPRVLPCSHNFCKKCLEGLLEGNVRNSLWRPSPFKCPTCRKETSATGVNSLQVNYSLKGIVEKYNKIKVSPKMPVCKGHLGQPLNIFCLTDMQLICGICATRGDHTKHVFCSIEDAYAQERDAFETLFQSFETWRRGDALSRLDTLETSKRKSLQLLTKDSDKVKEFFEKLQHTLDQKKNEILSDFETMKLAVMQAYDPEINKLNTILQEQRMAFNIAEAFKDVSEPIIFLQQMQEFREKIKPRPAFLEVHFLNRNTRAFFRVFGSCSKTIEMLTGRITVFIEQPAVPTWSSNSFPPQMTLLPLPPQRPSYHDLVFYCGSDSNTDNQIGVRYVSIKPDNRKLANGTNVLGLLIDTLLKEGFHLVSTRTVSSEDKSECYSFERIKTPEVLTMNKTPELEAEQSQKNK
ncbi:E3 ubiquitin-protein ligase TRIM13 [Sciurus carolinensis]|uniref:E3 ubiquitin-protein ligase TRIM13 n=1 Tax=Sciurus carolinensis TaxID=30640 RepID=A0AA41NI64_SCICA|nr:E3 ubiquitin-protein ligase TRIM13 [Sciurus carolinensis]